MSSMFRGARRFALAAAVSLGALGGALAPQPWSPARVALAADTAVIAHAEDGLSLRAEPAYGSEILATLANGSPVSLRTGSVDTVYDPDGETRWWPVSTSAGDGWVAGFYLELGGWQEPAPAAEPSEMTASEAAIAAWKESAPSVIDGAQWNLAGATAATVTEPDGVNLRAEPGLAGALLMTVPGGSTVGLRVAEAETVFADGSRWWPVEADGVVGWISGDYLEPADWASSATSPELANPAPAVNQDPAFTPGDYVEVVTDDGDGLNIRADGAPDAERVGLAPQGEVIQVMDGPSTDPLGNPWYMITDGDVTGWVFGQYLATADGPPAPEDEAPSAPATRQQDAGDSGDSPFGDNFPFGDDDPFGEGFPFGEKGVATGAFMYPLTDYVFTQGFGCTGLALEPWESSLGCHFHNGIDLAANEWTPVYAADGGIVELAGWCDCGLGYFVKIDHGNGFKTVYGHLVAYDVTPGEAVAKGERIASVGTTGNSTGSHLHFITQFKGVPYNPFWYLP